MTKLRVLPSVFLAILILVCNMGTLFAGCQTTTAGTAASQSSEAKNFQVTDDKLPYLLVIGDSISMGYTLPLRKSLATEINVFHVPGNGGDTAHILATLDQWVSATGKSHYKLILLNAGLHDLQLKADGSYAVPIQDYTANLDKIVQRLRALSDTVVWVTTTMVPEGANTPTRKAGDEVRYNAAANTLMDRLHVPIIDLYSLSKAHRDLYGAKPDNVHYNEAGYARFANQIAKQLQPYLK